MLAIANRLLDREDTLDAVIASYLHATDAGEPPNRLDLLVRHGEIASDLAEFFLAQDRLETLTSPLRACTHPDGLPTPHRLGDFKLIREIGRGGMGVVHEAEQISLKRRVAIKILPFASTLDSRHLQRFKNEAVAAATLHHSNIVPVFATGCEQGVHFYAMQLIEGRSLAEVIGDLRLRIGDCNSISNRHSRITHQQVAELGIQAAEALDHAHQAGIIHRDVKPANLLLSPLAPLGRGAGGEGSNWANSPRLWITDFGLAHFQSDAQLTMTGDFLGTLRYVSPEQALTQRGIVDHRTDVYSLSVTLYELLTLQPAFDGKDRREILRQIASEEPRSLRRIDRGIPRELETIVLKAMAKDPAHRYATAKELADDLRRFVLHEPIRARRPGVVQKSRMWARRHPSVTWSAAATLMLITVASVVSTVLISQAKGEQAVALETANNERARADTEAAIAKAVNRFLQRDLLSQAYSAPEHGQEIGGTPYLTVKEALDRAATRIGDRFQDQPLVEAAIRTTIGEAYRNIGENTRAVIHLERAVTLRQAHFGADHPDTFASLHRLALTLDWVGRVPDAIAIHQQLLEKQETKLGADHPDVLARRGSLAISYRKAGQWAASVRIFEQMLEKHRAINGLTHPVTIGTMQLLAMNYGDLGRLDDSIRLHEEVLELLGRSAIRPDDPQTLWPMTSCATAYERAGRYVEAEHLLRDALERCRKRKDAGGRIGTGNVLKQLGLNLMLQHNCTGAVPLLREALSIYEKDLPENWDCFHAMSLLGNALFGNRQYAEAEPLLLRGFEGMKQREAVMLANEKHLPTEAGERIVRFYEVTQRPNEAHLWREKLATRPAPH